jgi:hypothetical protein
MKPIRVPMSMSHCIGVVHDYKKCKCTLREPHKIRYKGEEVNAVLGVIKKTTTWWLIL